MIFCRQNKQFFIPYYERTKYYFGSLIKPEYRLQFTPLSKNYQEKMKNLEAAENILKLLAKFKASQFSDSGMI
jgi:hypothetical protein